MIMNGFDPSGMTDQEILERMTQLQARLGVASRYGSGAAEQLNNMIQLCSTVLTERFERKMFEARFGTAEGSEKAITMTDGESVETQKDIGEKAPVRVETTLRLRKSKRPVSNND